jgi:hypothetical protein
VVTVWWSRSVRDGVEVVEKKSGGFSLSDLESDLLVYAGACFTDNGVAD